MDFEMNFKTLNIIVILSIIFLGCEEMLPPHEEPTSVVTGVIQPLTLRIGVCGSNMLPGGPLLLNVGMKNVFDETLQNTKTVKVSLNVWLKLNPSVIKTIIFEMQNPEEIITIDPGEIYWIRLEWDHTDLYGDYAWQNIIPPDSLTPYGTEIEIKAANVPKFTPSKSLKEAVK